MQTSITGSIPLKDGTALNQPQQIQSVVMGQSTASTPVAINNRRSFFSRPEVIAVAASSTAATFSVGPSAYFFLCLLSDLAVYTVSDCAHRTDINKENCQAVDDWMKRDGIGSAITISVTLITTFFAVASIIYLIKRLASSSQSNSQSQEQDNRPLLQPE